MTAPSAHPTSFLRAAVLLASILATLTTGSLRAQETVGNPLINRADIDTATGAIFVELQGFAQGGQISSFAFYNDNVGTEGRQLTPLIFEQVGTDFVIRAVGAPVVNTATGAQTFPFTLAKGSTAVGPGFYFGYKNGADADPNEVGVIEFDFASGATSETYFGTNFSNNLDPGVNLGAGTFLGPNIGQQERIYSVLATSVPEPASGALLVFGVLSAMAIRRHRVG